MEQPTDTFVDLGKLGEKIRQRRAKAPHRFPSSGSMRVAFENVKLRPSTNFRLAQRVLAALRKGQ